MTEFTYRLASSGNDLVLLDYKSSCGFEPLYKFTPKSSNLPISILNNNSWCSDGSCIASSIKNSNKIVMTYSKKNVFTSSEILAANFSQPSKVMFLRSGLSKMILANQDTVALYDIKKKKVLKDFQLKSPLKCLSLNFDDHFIAAGCQNGYIYLLNNVTNYISSPLTSGGAEISALKYGHRAFLASGTNQGEVTFWDCNRMVKVKTFSDHLAPCSDINVSPINEKLILSAGLDKRFICYDNESKKSLINIKTEYPLTAVSILPNGREVALGTTSGLIVVYDMREMKPLHTYKAHSSSSNVTSVEFQPNQDNAALTSANLAKAKKGSSNSQNHLQPEQSVIMKENVPEQMEVDKSNDVLRRDSLTSQIISPLRGSPSGAGDLAKNVDFLQVSASPNVQVETTSASHDSLFSPLKEQSANSPNLSVLSNQSLLSSGGLPKTPVSSFNKTINTPLISPLTMIKEEDLEPPSSDEDITPPKMAKFGASKQDENAPTSLSTTDNVPKTTSEVVMSDHLKNDKVLLTTGSTLHTFKESQLAASSTPTTEKPKETSNDEVSQKKSDIQYIMNAFPQVLMETRASDNVDSQVLNQETVVQNNNNTTSGTSNLTTFQQEYLKSCVEDAMDDFCTDMRQMLWHMQYDTIRLFQNQRQEMDELLRHYAINDVLRAENERLKKENEELRSYF